MTGTVTLSERRSISVVACSPRTMRRNIPHRRNGGTLVEWVCKHYDVPCKYLLEHTTINLCKLHSRKLISFWCLFADNLHFRFIFPAYKVNVARLLYLKYIYRCSQFQSTLMGNYELMPASCSSLETILKMVSWSGY